MAAALISPLAHSLSFLRDHPKLSCVLLLLLSPPIYRILLFFTPLLLSTALCIFALITLTPYVTATDAEVERQSMLGASASQQIPKKKVASSSSIHKERKLDNVPGYGKLSSTTAPPVSSSLSAASPSGSDAETSWFSWMMGLNEIGRTWMENKLIEQGLALSEPANRETLLSFIEGSFEDLITAQPNPSAELFAAIGNDEDETVAAVSAQATEKNEASATECGSESYALQQSVNDGDVCAKASHNGDRALTDDARNEEMTGAENQSTVTTSDVCAVSKQNIEPVLDDVNNRNQKQKIYYESSLPVIDATSDMPSVTIMPKTPSRIPAPSKLLEASRRIFSKEEQNRSMLPRAPLQTSCAGRVNQPSKPSFGSTQSKNESSVSVFKLPARKFLERSRSIPSKEGSKLISATSVGSHAAGRDVQAKMKNSDGSHATEVNKSACDAYEDTVDAVCDINNGVTDFFTKDAGEFTSGSDEDGPRFDEDLMVEEAQALVQSELKMLEVELDEVAAKLPKLDETFAYQKTPIKSMATSLAPIGASTKCNSTILFASPAF